MGRLRALGNRLYRGEVSYDFIGRRKIWYVLSSVVLLLSVGAVGVRGLNLNVDFLGGSELIVSDTRCSPAQARDAVLSTGLGGEPRVQQVGGDDVRVQTGRMTPEQSRAVQQALARACGVAETQVSANFVGPTWGADVSANALRGLGVFLLLVTVFLSFYFEWKMALAAMLALLHDLVITVGIYALVGLEVSPSTVIGLLTVLGYSLYDTVVVFDKVRENTAGLQGGSRATYSEAANLAVNQTLVRSINTSVISLLPVAAILFVGAGLLGAGTLKDLSLVLMVGLAAGSYSSIFIATPFLAQLKEREPAVQALARRVAARRAAGRPTPATRSGAHALGGSAPGEGPRDQPTGPGEEALDGTGGAGEPVTSGTAGRGAGPRRPAAGGQRSQPRRAPTAQRRGPEGRRRR